MMQKISSRSHFWPGVPMALLSAALFGATPAFSKLLLAEIPPFMLAGLLYLGAGLGLAIYHLVFRRAPVETSIKPQDYGWLGAAVVMGGVVGPVLLMLGLTNTAASSAALLLNLEGLATMVIAWVVFRENVDTRLIIGAFSILAGALLLSWDGSGIAINSGSYFIAGACLAWGIDNNLTRKISAADPIVTVMIKGIVAGIVNIGLAFSTSAALPSLPFIAASAVLGLFGIGVSLVMFILALRHLGTARTGAYFSFAPFIGAIIALVVLNEPVSVNLLFCAVLMIFGLWLHLTERHDHNHTHIRSTHEHVHYHDSHHTHAHNDDDDILEPHSHEHKHETLEHNHAHFPDLHHRHSH